MNVRRFLLVIMAAGLAAAVFVVAQRSVELAPGASVELALSLQAARASSVTQAEPFDRILDVYRRAGVTSLLLSGTTLEGLIEFGGVGYPADYRVWVSVVPGDGGEHSVVAVRDNPVLAEWLRARLAARVGPDRVKVVPAEAGLVYIQVNGVGVDALRRLNLGVHPADLALADSLGLRPALHMAEVPGGPAGPAVPGELLAGLPAGAPVLLTGANLGSGVTAAGEAAAGLGPAEIAALLAGNGGHPLLLDHSQPPFSAGMPGSIGAVTAATGYRAVKMFRVTFHHDVEDVVTAVTERQMRFVLVQPFHLTGDVQADLTRQGAAWAEVMARLRAAGLSPGAAQPLTAYHPPLWTRLAAGAAAGAGTALLLGGWGSWPVALLLVAGGGLAGLVPLWAPPLGLDRYEVLVLQLLALVCAAAVPAAGGLLAWNRRAHAGILPGVAAVAAAALAAGTLVTVILGDVRFMLELALFRGIKAALIAPPLLLLASVAWADRQSLGGALRRPIRVWHVGVAVIAVPALALMLVRSGQDSGLLLVSNLELQVRQWLEQILIVRPRFKEFLVGWPLVVLGLSALRRERQALGLLLLAAGLMAPASLVNSFAHLHTPVGLSALRSVHGLWIGVAGGTALAALWWRQGGVARV